MIIDNENHFSISMMCRLLLVSRSGYYAWRHRPPSVREQSDRLLKIEIKRVFDDGKGRPGAPRIARRLHDEGKAAGRHRVARIMRDNGWRAKAARKYKATTNSKHSLPVAPNLLEQDFMADKPDQKWVSDTSAPCGYHLYLDGRGLAVLGGGARALFAAGDWLGNCRTHDGNTGV